MACRYTSVVLDSLIVYIGTQSVILSLHLMCTYQPCVVITRRWIPLAYVYYCSHFVISTSGSRRKATISSKILVSHPLPSTLSIRLSMIMLTAYLSTLPSDNSNLYNLVLIIGFHCSSPMWLPEAYSFLCFTRAITGMEYLPGTTNLGPI